MSSSHGKGDILIHAWKHSYTILQLMFFSPSPFVVTMPSTGSSDAHHAQPAGALKSVLRRRCTTWQTATRGQYLGCWIENIFVRAFLLPWKLHRFSSVEEAHNLPPLHHLLLERYLGEGEVEKRKGSGDKQWRDAGKLSGRQCRHEATLLINGIGSVCLECRLGRYVEYVWSTPLQNTHTI